MDNVTKIGNWREFWLNRVRSRDGLLWLASLVLTDGVALLALSESKQCKNDLSYGFSQLARPDARLGFVGNDVLIQATRCLNDITSYSFLLVSCALMTILLFKCIPTIGMTRATQD